MSVSIFLLTAARTATRLRHRHSRVLQCVPLPPCDPDSDNGSDTDRREFTAAEVDKIGITGEPLLIGEGAYCCTNINPSDLAGFKAEPYVVIDVAVFENRPAGYDASLGVDADDMIVGESRQRICLIWMLYLRSRSWLRHRKI